MWTRSVAAERLALAQEHGVPICKDDAALPPDEIRRKYAAYEIGPRRPFLRLKGGDLVKVSIALPERSLEQLVAHAMGYHGGNRSAAAVCLITCGSHFGGCFPIEREEPRGT